MAKMQKNECGQYTHIAPILKDQAFTIFMDVRRLYFHFINAPIEFGKSKLVEFSGECKN